MRNKIKSLINHNFISHFNEKLRCPQGDKKLLLIDLNLMSHVL